MRNTIILSDLHVPYQHRDSLPFIRAIVDRYDIKDAKNVGDLTDGHTTSFHDIEPGTYSAYEEHRRSCIFIKQLEEIFPKMTIVLGNHCSLTERKAVKAGIMPEHIKDFNSRYDVNWNWVDYEFFKIDNYNQCLIQHSISTSTLNNATKFSHCSIQGHFHSTFGIEYFADCNMLRWSMTVGCLIDSNSPAFNYARKAVLKRPIIGCGAIINNKPILIPMQLTKSGRWNKRV